MTETYQYDSLNQVTSIKNETWNKALSFSYDAAGNRTKIIDPEDRVMTYQYNARNEMVSVMDPDENVTTYQYDGVGNISEMVRSNGVKTSYQYNENNQLTQLTHKGKDYLKSFEYTFDKVGNRLSQEDESGAVTSYKYDKLYRLTAVDYPKKEIDEIKDETYTPPQNKHTGNKQSRTEENSTDSSLIDTITGWFTNDEDKTQPTSGEEDSSITVSKPISKKDTKDEKNDKDEKPDKKENKFFSAIKKVFQKSVEAVVEFFQSLWEGIANFFGKKVEAKTLDHKDKGPNKENKGHQTDQNNKQPNDEKKNPGNKGNSDNKPNNGKNQNSKKNDKYYSIEKGPKGPKGWKDFYEDGPEEVKEHPDYLIEPIDYVEYFYDAVGNRVRKVEDGKETSYLYNEADMLLKDGDDTYIYDVNGNVVEKKSENGTVKYEYTTYNRLKGVYYPDGSNVEYGYDAMRRKVTRTQSYFDLASLRGGKGTEHALNQGNGNNSDVLNTEETNYLYEGMNVFKEHGENGQQITDQRRDYHERYNGYS